MKVAGETWQSSQRTWPADGSYIQPCKGDHLQCRSKGNISGGGGACKCWRREALGGSGGMLPQKNLKSRELEMLFPAFSKSYL